MPVRPELHVRLPNSPGALAAVCRILADDHVDIVAFGLESHGLLRLVVDNHVRALAVLKGRRHAVVEREALVAHVPASAGGCEQLSGKSAAVLPGHSSHSPHSLAHEGFGVHGAQASGSPILASEQLSPSVTLTLPPPGSSTAQHPKQSQPLGVRGWQLSRHACVTEQASSSSESSPVRHSVG